MEQLYFQGANDELIYFFFGSSGNEDSALERRETAVHFGHRQQEVRAPSAFLNEEQTNALVTVAESQEDRSAALSASSGSDHFEVFWTANDRGEDLLRFRMTTERSGYDVKSDTDIEWVEETTVDFPAELAGDIAAYVKWMNDRTAEEPAFWRRNAIAIELCGLEGREVDLLKKLDETDLKDAIRIIGNVAHRGRVDRAVLLLERLYKIGRLTLSEARLVPIFHIFEEPQDVSWEVLYRWAGLTLPLPPLADTLAKPRAIEDDGYSAYDYCACFEDAFEDQFGSIDFDAMDFKDVQARLRRLAENLEAHYSNVNYPLADEGEVVPNIALTEREMSSGGPGEGGSIMSFTPSLPYDEARRLLLFAHRVSFEDPLYQIVEPIVGQINNRPFTVPVTPRSARDIVFGSMVQVDPPKVDQRHYDILRETLKNTQRLEALIRAKIVIPHQFRDVDISPGDWEGNSFPRFPNRKVRAEMEDAAVIFGNLLGGGALKGFGFPEEIERVAAEFREQGADAFDDDDPQGFYEIDPWVNDFYWGDNGLWKKHAPFEHWLDYLYRYAMYDRYHAIKGLGYCQHFEHEDAQKLAAVVEAADLLQGAAQQEDASEARLAYAKRLRADDVRLQRLSASLRPKMIELDDQDLIKIRLEEGLFEDWRTVVQESLQAVESYDAVMGTTSPNLVRQEIADRMKDWSAKRDKGLKSRFLGGAFDIGEGAAVSVVTGLALGAPATAPALIAGAAWTTVKSTVRLFRWRHREGLIRRHFLSVA